MIDHTDLLIAQGLFDNHSNEILYQKWLDEISAKDYEERISNERNNKQD